jgi:hydroxyacylglutathione hydrolase
MKINYFTFNPFSTNCFVLSSGNEAVIVDPSCHSQEEIDTVTEFLKTEGLTPAHILLTHAHIDHIFGCGALSRYYGLPVLMHREDESLIHNAKMQAGMFGLTFDEEDFDTVFRGEEDVIRFGDRTLSILHTPGHSPGSVSFHDPEGGYALCGDVLFNGSIGRTDLWRGSLPELMRSIFQKLVPLGEATVVYPGHGPETTIGEELSSNPFLLDAKERV